MKKLVLMCFALIVSSSLLFGCDILSVKKDKESSTEDKEVEIKKEELSEAQMLQIINSITPVGENDNYSSAIGKVNEVIKETLYPFETKEKEIKINYMIEPNSEEMLQEIISLYVKTKVTSVLLNATLSENASRNNAMKKAKDNADDLKKELILYYNKLRQQEITNELSDIVNGI